MPDQDTYWHEQIHNIMPDLEILAYELHQEGLINDVLIVNNEWVFRFSKTEWARELMTNEDRLMVFLGPKLPLPIPKPVKRADGVIVYQHLVGEHFTRQAWIVADEAGKQAYADHLGAFLDQLHHVDPGEIDWEVLHSYAPVTHETWLEIHDRVIDRVYPLLLPHQVDWVENLFGPALTTPDFFNFEPALVHGDLAPYHILYDPNQHRLTAVIDFGVAGLGDPATDLGSLLNYYGESLVSKLRRTYPELERLMGRARFYAQAIELQWVLLGLESREKYWFTSHLGNARDIQEGR
jgi:aminoglycoside 2''-phosphotransferase